MRWRLCLATTTLSQDHYSCQYSQAIMVLKYGLALLRISIIWTLACFWGSVVVATLIWKTIRRPLSPFWHMKKRDVPPPTLTDPQWGTHKFIKLKNVKIHYVEKGDTSKPLMVFVHGFPEFWYTWRHQIKEFSKDYWTVALDMRGYGDSDKPTGVDSYQIEYLINDVKEFVQGLGREKFILVAHDWGGVVAWQFLFNFPEMVERYIIMDAPHPAGFRKSLMSNKRQFLMSWYIFFFQLPYLPEVLMQAYDLVLFRSSFRKHRSKAESRVTDEEIEAFKYTFSQPGAFTAPINYYRANFGGKQQKEFDLKKQLPSGLFITGEKDDYLSQEVLAKVKDYAPNCKYEVIMGANHFVQQDDPEAVNTTMRKFLET